MKIIKLFEIEAPLQFLMSSIPNLLNSTFLNNYAFTEITENKKDNELLFQRGKKYAYWYSPNIKKFKQTLHISFIETGVNKYTIRCCYEMYVPMADFLMLNDMNNLETEINELRVGLLLKLKH